MPTRPLKKSTKEVPLLPDTATLAALLTGSAVILPALAKVIPKDKDQVADILCRTGLRYKNDERSRVAVKLTQAGIDKKPEWFLGFRLSLMGAFLVMCLPFLFFGMDLFWVILLGPLLYFAPTYWLNMKIAKRKSEIRLSLADFVLYLSTALSAGSDIRLGLREAANSVGGALKKETERTLMECSTAKSFNSAITDMAERCDVDELRTLARVLVQANRYGTPMAEAMRNHSEQMRTVRRFEVMEAANKLSVKMVIPVMLLILGPCMLAIGYPAIVSLLNVF